MGADLYISSEIKPLHEKLNPLFEDALKERDAIEDKDSKEYELASEKVNGIYNELYPDTCYFRDSYNPSSVMWALDLSWWTDVIPMLDDEGNLSSEKAEELVNMIEDREIELRSDQEPLGEDYFQERKEALLKFLRQSVDSGEPIECSL
jgi:hypothetical protein